MNLVFSNKYVLVLGYLNTNRRRPNDNSNYIGVPLEFSETLIIECKCSYFGSHVEGVLYDYEKCSNIVF